MTVSVKNRLKANGILQSLVIGCFLDKQRKMCGTCDGRYARSRQGLCKVGQIILGMLIWIVIAASPYWKPIFILEGQTWPFHLVMLFIFLPWLATIIMYFIFLSGYHYNFG